MGQVLHLDDDTLAKRLLDIDELWQEVGGLRVGEFAIHCVLRKLRCLVQCAARRAPKIFDVAGNDSLAQLLLVDGDLLVLVGVLLLARGQLLLDVRVLLDALQCQPLLGLLLEYPRQKVEEGHIIMRDVGGRPVIRRRHHLDQLLLVRGEEGKRARRHRVECHTERPDIGALGLVLGLPPYFRCSVAGCAGAADGQPPLPVAILLVRRVSEDGSRDAKVGDDSAVVVSYQDVVRLEVEVDNVLVVQVGETRDSVGEPTAAVVVR
mmetsp:Transcript_29500/g.80557  ORF Transcript_29500/g.80557 Transcript_29500/m.80557 type:complete len:264 (+) Transcript_29500:1719-2510(+)